MDCLRCGEKTTEDDNFCTRCIDNGWIECEACGIISDNSDRGTDGEPLCEECFNDKYNICDDCGRTISRGDSQGVGDSIFCDSCYERSYFYCERCNTSYYNDEYGSDGYCSACSENNENEKCSIKSVPASQEEVQEMINMLISGIPARRKYCVSVNRKDYMLTEIGEGIGRIDSQIYLYGLKDRPEYQISLTTGIYELLLPVAIETNFGLLIPSPIGWITAVKIDQSRLHAIGICKSLRVHSDWVVDFIKKLALMKNGCPEMAKAA